MTDEFLSEALSLLVVGRDRLSDFDLPVDLFQRMGRWHDLGKAHAAFQEMLVRDRPDLQDVGEVWSHSERDARILHRPYFRHELVSTTARCE